MLPFLFYREKIKKYIPIFLPEEWRIFRITMMENAEEEFVFGAYNSPQLGIATQIPIESIERRSGLRFGPLTKFDPLINDEESAGQVEPDPLLSFEQIRFL